MTIGRYLKMVTFLLLPVADSPRAPGTGVDYPGPRAYIDVETLSLPLRYLGMKPGKGRKRKQDARTGPNLRWHLIGRSDRASHPHDYHATPGNIACPAS